MLVDLRKLGDGADNRSRTYDLRITNAKFLYFNCLNNHQKSQIYHFKS